MWIHPCIHCMKKPLYKWVGKCRQPATISAITKGVKYYSFVIFASFPSSKELQAAYTMLFIYFWIATLFLINHVHLFHFARRLTPLHRSDWELLIAEEPPSEFRAERGFGTRIYRSKLNPTGTVQHWLHISQNPLLKANTVSKCSWFKYNCACKETVSWRKQCPPLSW